jgi:hypothetical protein
MIYFVFTHAATVFVYKQPNRRLIKVTMIQDEMIQITNQVDTD